MGEVTSFLLWTMGTQKFKCRACRRPFTRHSPKSKCDNQQKENGPVFSTCGGSFEYGNGVEKHGSPQNLDCICINYIYNIISNIYYIYILD